MASAVPPSPTTQPGRAPMSCPGPQALKLGPLASGSHPISTPDPQQCDPPTPLWGLHHATLNPQNHSTATGLGQSGGIIATLHTSTQPAGGRGHGSLPGLGPSCDIPGASVQHRGWGFCLGWRWRRGSGEVIPSNRHAVLTRHPFKGTTPQTCDQPNKDPPLPGAPGGAISSLGGGRGVGSTRETASQGSGLALQILIQCQIGRPRQLPCSSQHFLIHRMDRSGTEDSERQGLQDWGSLRPHATQA